MRSSFNALNGQEHLRKQMSVGILRQVYTLRRGRELSYSRASDDHGVRLDKPTVAPMEGQVVTFTALMVNEIYFGVCQSML